MTNTNNHKNHPIYQALIDCAYIWRHEFITIFHDFGVMIFLFLLPFGYPIMYGLIYNPQTPRNVPVVIVDNARTALSRQYCRMLDATEQVKVAGYASSLEEAKVALAREKAYAIVSLDRDFERNILRGEQSHVMLYSAVYSMIYYRIFAAACTNVNNAMSAQLQAQQLPGATLRQLSVAITPVKNTSLAVYNPTSGFATFIMPGVELLVIQQSLLLGIGMLAGTQRERNRNKRLIPLNHHYFGPLRIITGKALCYVTFSILTTFWTMNIVPRIFKLPHLSDFWEIQLFLLPFVLASILMAMTFSCIVKGRELPLIIFTFTSLPLIFAGGISWPWASIPKFWQHLMAIFPSTYGIQGYVQMASCDAPLSSIRFYYLFEWALVLFYLLTAFFVYRYELRCSLKMIDKPSGTC
ncbi:MAG: ABC transporter permease [Marinifilaceae bacterium]